MKKIALLLLLIQLIISCSKIKDKAKSQTLDQTVITINPSVQIPAERLLTANNSSSEKDAGKEFLQNIFKCKSGKGFCFYLDQEENITTPRFYEFMVDSEEIYGASNLTESEIPLAVKKYKQKWSKIYPLRKEMEPWLFGRGQDDMENIQNVEVERIEEFKYRVLVTFDENFKTDNILKLVPDKKTFLIDYCETIFLN